MKVFISPQRHGIAHVTPGWRGQEEGLDQNLSVEKAVSDAAFVRCTVYPQQCTHAGETEVRVGNISL